MTDFLQSSAIDTGAASGVGQWRAQGAYLEINDYRIFVRDEGDSGADTILLIHGFPTSSWDWHALWPGLRKGHRLVALDMLGFGFSDKPDNREYTIHLQADIIEALVQKKSLGSFHVLAHDYGDTVAQELLARQLDGNGAGSWRSCCFLNGGLFPETHRALLTQKLLLSPFGPLVNKLGGYKSFARSFRKVFGPDTQPSDEELLTFWHIISENDGRHIFHNLITYINDRIAHRERWVAALQSSPVPIALINGSVDPVSGEHMIARYQQLQGRLDYLARLPTIGHYPQVEDPHAVLQHYLQFLGSV
ncbi:MAG: alpha/beta hydrolase [Pseudomonadales bacterium]